VKSVLFFCGVVTVDDMQIDPGTEAATAAPSGLQMNSLNSAIIGGASNVNEKQIDPGTIVVPTTLTAPSGLQVKDLSNFLWGNC